MESKITLQRNKTAFALDNDGFRYALATAKGADLKSFERDAQTSWRISRDAVIEMMRKIKEMNPYTTESILSLNESYEAVQQMCQVSKIVVVIMNSESKSENGLIIIVFHGFLTQATI